MARSKVGEQGGFLNDADAVDAMKITFFIGSFVAFYKALKGGYDWKAAVDEQKRLTSTEKKIFVGASFTPFAPGPLTGLAAVQAYRSAMEGKKLVSK